MFMESITFFPEKKIFLDTNFLWMVDPRYYNFVSMLDIVIDFNEPDIVEVKIVFHCGNKNCTLV